MQQRIVAEVVVLVQVPYLWLLLFCFETRWGPFRGRALRAQGTGLIMLLMVFTYVSSPKKNKEEERVLHRDEVYSGVLHHCERSVNVSMSIFRRKYHQVAGKNMKT